MNTDNGALEFDAYINNEKLISSINEAEKRVKGFSDATVKEASKIDDAFEITAENIRIQKDVIASLETQINNLNIQISKMKPGTAQDDLKRQAAQVTAELKAEKDALKQLEAAVKTNEVQHRSFRSQIREAREELIRMEQAGLRGTKAYQDLQAKLGSLTDAMSDAQAQASVLANDERGFRGVVSMIGGFTGAMSAAQGAVGMFAGENENLQKIMLKVQSLMAITIGLQQVAEMLNKDSYFSIVILTKAKEMLAVAEMKFATALGISTAAARVLMATLTLGLSIAITAIVVALSKLSTKQAEAKKQQEELNKAVADSAYEPIAAIRALSTEWNTLGNNLKSKQQFIEDNAEKFKDLGIAVNSVNDAEKILTDPKTLQNITSAFIHRAKAMAATEMAAKKYKESLEKQLELDNTPQTTTKYMQGGTPSAAMAGRTIQVKNRKYTKLSNEITELEEQGNNLFRLAAGFTEKEKLILKQIGQSAEKITAGSIAAQGELISKLKEQYSKVNTDSERGKILAKIREAEALLAKMDKSTKTTKTKQETEKEKYISDYDKYGLEIIKKYGDAEIDYRRSLISDKKALIDFDLEQEIAAIDEMERIYKEKAQKAGVPSPDLSSFAAMRTTATQKADSGKKAVDNEELKRQNAEVFQFAIDQYEKLKELKEKYKDEYLKIEEDYQSEIALLGKDSPEAKLARESRDKKMSELTRGKIEETELYSLVSDQNIQISKETTDLIIADLKRRVEAALAANQITKAEADKMLQDIATAQQKSGEAKNQNNPFAQLGTAISNKKAYNAAKSDPNTSIETLAQLEKQAGATTASMAGAAGAALMGVEAIIGSVVDGLDQLGLLTQEEKKDAENIIGMVGGAANLAMGIATGNPMQIIQGSVDLLVNAFEYFDYKSKDIAKKQKALVKEVDNLKDAYDRLELAVSKAFSKDAARLQEQEIKNLQAQINANNEWIEQENRKKKKKQDQEAIEAKRKENEDLRNRIADTKDAIIESITGTSVMSAIDNFASSYADAFTSGENAALKSTEIVRNIFKSALIERLKSDLQPGITQLMDMISAAMADGILTADEKAAIEMKKREQDAIAKRNEGMFSDLGLNDTTKGKTGLSGAIQNVSEETASIISGQLNAIRINQIDSINVMRNQLLALNEISANTAYNVNLTRLVEILDVLKTISSAGAMRSQGL
jgi:DNA repair exonuclease SbcCD ATPase subunit